VVEKGGKPFAGTVTINGKAQKISPFTVLGRCDSITLSPFTNANFT
jgi:hypothetical protein